MSEPTKKVVSKGHLYGFHMEGPACGSRSGFLGFLSTLVLPLRIGGATHEAEAFGKLFYVLVDLIAY